MSGNTFGQLFTLTSFGESHGPAIGGVVDGCPPGLSLSEADLQLDLDRRKPGTSKFVTQRKEDDEIEILSGVFEGKTTGAPIGLLLEIKINVARIIRKLKKHLDRGMQTLPTNKNMALGITEGVGDQVLGKLLLG